MHFVLKSLLFIGLAAPLVAPAYAQQRLLPEGVHAGIGFENGGHDTVGPYKFRTFIEMQDQLKLGERIKIDGTFSGEIRELQGVAVVYEQPLGGNWKLTMNGAFSHSSPGGFIDELFDQSTVDKGGGGSALGSTLSYTHQPDDKLTMIFSGGFQSVDVRTEQNPNAGFPGLVPRQYTQRTRDLQASVAINYNFSDNTGLFSAFGIEQGVDWLDPSDIRQNFDDTATILHFSGSLKHNLPNNFQVVLRGGMQWSPDRVNQLKLYSIGGWDYASGYLPGERSGDIGGGARLELNYLNVAELALLNTQVYYQPFIFIDGGFTRINDAIRGADIGGDASLSGESDEVEKKASAGAGISFETTSGLHAGLQASYPISGATDFRDREQDARFLFSVGIKQ